MPSQTCQSRVLAFSGMLCLASALFPAMASADTVRELLSDGRFGLAITVTPPPGTAVYAVEEELPPGLDVLRIGEDGVWDPYTRKVKWGPFTDDVPRVLDLELMETDGTFPFSGMVAFDDSGALPIGGASETVRDDPQTYFEGWLRLNFTDGRPLPAEDTVLPGASLPLLAQYAMGLEPGSPENPFRIEAGDDALHLRFQRDNRRSDINFVLEESEDLIEWRSVDFDEAGIQPLDAHRDTIEMEVSGSEGFYRLRFE